MLRIILAIVLGYVAMGVLVMLGFSLVFLAPDFAYEKDSFDVTPGWLIYALILGLVAAMVGGAVTAKIARSMCLPALLIFAAIAFVVGLVSAAANLQRPKPPTGEAAEQKVAKMTTAERVTESVQPIGYSFALPFVGAAGIIAGGLLVARRRPVEMLAKP